MTISTQEENLQSSTPGTQLHRNQLANNEAFCHHIDCNMDEINEGRNTMIPSTPHTTPQCPASTLASDKSTLLGRYLPKIDSSLLHVTDDNLNPRGESSEQHSRHSVASQSVGK
ncbi:hypothetical protein CDL15_Pgr011897 [Punica granatum]|uniref:Uncharacterized protein n=1 Tax=Punica granatum TaxID=22663 RepID=A0A218WR26_PUNGR|nr:hypothetical protein CDL15_Pgr011897 [Punica granatum]